MPYLLVRHKLADYARWKPIFDEHGAFRKANGCKGGELFCTSADRNELVILLEWDDLGKARQFAESQDLREAMQRAGVADHPDIFFLESVERLRE